MSPTPLEAAQPGEFVVVFVTAPDADVAANLAKTPVAEKLVACVNVLPGLRSIYAWEGKVLRGRSLLYASLRFAEAYGLWRGKAWAEWLAAISGAIYVPFEMVELAKKVTALRTASLLVNLVVVGYMLSILRRRPHTETGAVTSNRSG